MADFSAAERWLVSIPSVLSKAIPASFRTRVMVLLILMLPFAWARRAGSGVDDLRQLGAVQLSRGVASKAAAVP
jgi:hypothetical protein